MRSRLDSVRVVLVSPMYGGNVGAVARACANFDVSDLRIVAPLCDARGREAKLYAKGPAAEVLLHARCHERLDEALAGSVAAVGFTRRGGALRKPSVEASGLGALVALNGSGSASLVFGREDGGLTRDELLACTHVCSFEVGKSMPSLNLSHAVAVALSRVYEQVGRETSETKGKRREPEAEEGLASHEQLAELFGHWRQVMHDAGMTAGGNPERALAHIRRALGRSRLTSQELGIFRAYLSKTQVAMGTRRRLKA